MHNIKKYRKYIVILLITLIVVLAFLSAIAWNYALKGELLINSPVLAITIILIFIIGIFMFIIAYRLSDKTKIDEHINKIVEKEKADIIAEFEKKEAKEEISDKKEVNTSEIVKRIIPGSQNLNTLKSFVDKLLSNISKEIEIVQGLFYIKTKKANLFTIAGEYAFTGDKKPGDFKTGETLPGQAAKNKELMIINEIPDKYFTVESGMGKSLPKNIIIVPVINKSSTIAVIELGKFKEITDTEQKVLKELSKKISDKITKFNK
jgi:putative methionine-R-sulfoxide reductase with GAF domain